MSKLWDLDSNFLFLIWWLQCSEEMYVCMYFMLKMKKYEAKDVRGINVTFKRDLKTYICDLKTLLKIIPSVVTAAAARSAPIPHHMWYLQLLLLFLQLFSVQIKARTCGRYLSCWLLPSSVRWDTKTRAASAVDPGSSRFLFSPSGWNNLRWTASPQETTCRGTWELALRRVQTTAKGKLWMYF